MVTATVGLNIFYFIIWFEHIFSHYRTQKKRIGQSEKLCLSLSITHTHARTHIHTHTSPVWNHVHQGLNRKRCKDMTSTRNSDFDDP